MIDDAPLDAATHAFAVEPEIDDERDGDLVRDLWETAPGDYGVPYAMVLCRNAKTAAAPAAHLLTDLCGVTVAAWRYPPNRGVCPYGYAYAVAGGAVRWLRGACASFGVVDGESDVFRVDDVPDRPR